MNKHTEESIQDRVYGFCALKNHPITVPNSKLYSWEADMLSLTLSSFVHEFEIKISVADFRRDATKLRTRVLANPSSRFDGFVLKRGII